MKHHAIFFSLLLFFIPVISFGQKTAVVYGIVKNSDGAPVENVSVSIVEFPDLITSSNSKGEFELTAPADTPITIQFSFVAFEKKSLKLKLAPGERKKSVIKMEKDGITLADVEIVDQEKRNFFIHEIPIKTIDRQMSATGDFNAIIFTQPGVSQSNELSSGYSVRGGNFDENLVYVNDIEVYRPFLVRSGQQEGLSFVNGDMVSGILFSGGGFEAKYGDKMSSVLDIRYRKPREFKGSASASLLGETVHLEGSSTHTRFTWLLGARYKTSKYVLNSLDTKGEYKPRFYDVQSYLTYDITDEWEINFLSNISSNKYQLVPQTRESDFGTVNQALRLTVYFGGQEIDQYETYTGALAFIKRPRNKNLTLKYITSIYRTLEDETFDIEGAYRLDQLETDLSKDNFGDVAFNLGVGSFLNHARNYLDATVYNFEHRGTKVYPLHEYSAKKITSQIDWGIKYQHEQINDFLSEWRLIDSTGYLIPQLSPNLVELQDVLKTQNHLSSNRMTSFIQRLWSKTLKDTSEVSLNVGVRGNYWDLNKQFIASPRATFSWKPNWKKDIVLKAASGYYYQPPFYREMRDLYGNVNKNLKAQASIHFLLGSDWNFKAWNRPFKFVSEIYYKHLDHLVPYEVDNVRIRYYAKNNAHGYATGIDFKINGEFVKGVDSWFSLSLLQTREDVKDDYYLVNYNSDDKVIIPGFTRNDSIVRTERKEPGFVPRPTDQLVTAGLFFQDYLPRFPKFKMHMNLLFGSGLPFGPPDFNRYKDTLRIPPYRRVDIGFSYELIGESTEFRQKKILRHFNSIWLTAEVFNLLGTNNTVSYLWIKDVTDRTYAIPNYLTSRLVNLKLIVKF